MKPISEWSLFTKLASGLAVLTTLGGAVTFAEDLAESPFQPFVFKYQIAGVVDTLNVIQLQATKRGLSDLRSQRLMLKESIERETDPDDKREKMLRLESIEGDIVEGDKDYIKLRCQVERRAC